jgi:hypothetical protein
VYEKIGSKGTPKFFRVLFRITKKLLLKLKFALYFPRRCRLEGELQNATYDNPDINLRHARRYSQMKAFNSGMHIIFISKYRTTAIGLKVFSIGSDALAEISFPGTRWTPDWTPAPCLAKITLLWTVR